MEIEFSRCKLVLNRGLDEAEVGHGVQGHSQVPPLLFQSIDVDGQWFSMVSEIRIASAQPSSLWSLLK